MSNLPSSFSRISRNTRKSLQIEARNGALTTGRLMTRSSFLVRAALARFKCAEARGSSQIEVVMACICLTERTAFTLLRYPE